MGAEEAQAGVAEDEPEGAGRDYLRFNARMISKANEATSQIIHQVRVANTTRGCGTEQSGPGVAIRCKFNSRVDWSAYSGNEVWATPLPPSIVAIRTCAGDCLSRAPSRRSVRPAAGTRSGQPSRTLMCTSV